MGSNLKEVPLEKRAAQNGVNNYIVSRALRRVLAARIVVFQHFLQVARQVDGGLQEKHKRIWLLFQLFDQLDCQCGGSHPFIRIINKLRRASNDALDELISRLSGIIDKEFPRSRLILGSTKRSGPPDYIPILACQPPSLEHFDQ